jgi:signal transduction histidine kinase
MIAGTVEGSGGAVRVVSRPVVSNGEVTAVIQAAQSRTLIRETVLGLAAVLGAVGLGALGLAALGGLYMSRKAIRPAQDAFRLQRDFTADASHELKTPLALVRINAEEIEQDPTSRENREIVADQLAEIGRMDALLSDLLVLSRLDADRLEVERDPFDLSITAVETAERFLRRTADAGARLEVEVPDELLARGDAGRTDQILAVLLDNAIHHTPKGGAITIAGQALDGRAEVSVANTGSSIPEEHLNQIFERFYRADPQSEARGRTGGGTGLGLAIARDLARAQGGDLTAENAVQAKSGSAVVFRLSLPSER